MLFTCHHDTPRLVVYTTGAGGVGVQVEPRRHAAALSYATPQRSAVDDVLSSRYDATPCPRHYQNWDFFSQLYKAAIREGEGNSFSPLV